MARKRKAPSKSHNAKRAPKRLKSIDRSKRQRVAKSKKTKVRLSKRTRDLRLQHGLRALRTEKTLAAAAREAGIRPETLRAHAVKKKLLIKRGKKWVVQKDVPRRLLVYSESQEHVIKVGKFKSASLVGEYMAGVRWFVQSNDLHHLEPFLGKSVTDISGKCFPLETRPNVLHRLANTGTSSFEDVYRLVL
jgi:hypothetical protein